MVPIFGESDENFGTIFQVLTTIFNHLVRTSSMDDDLSSLFICEDYGLSEYIFALENCDDFTLKLLGNIAIANNLLLYNY